MVLMGDKKRNIEHPTVVEVLSEELPKIGYERSALELRIYIRKDLLYKDAIGYFEMLSIQNFRCDNQWQGQSPKIEINQALYEQEDGRISLEDDKLRDEIFQIVLNATNLLLKPGINESKSVIDNLEKYIRSNGIRKIVSRTEYDFE